MSALCLIASVLFALLAAFGLESIGGVVATLPLAIAFLALAHLLADFRLPIRSDG